MSETEKTPWRLAGEELGACSCAWGCPCQFNAPPTRGYCGGLLCCEVRNGHFGDIVMDGIRFGMMGAFPGPIHEGNGTLQIIISDKVTAEQRQALLEITSGRHGGALFEIFNAICTAKRDPLFAPIHLETNREKRTGKISIPGLMEVLVEPIKNPVTGEEHRARIVLPFGFEYKEAEMGNSLSVRTTCAAPLDFDYQNTYAQLNAFDWGNQ